MRCATPAATLARAAPSARGVKVWGPTPAFYQILRGRTRERLLVQAEKSVDVQAYLRSWLAAGEDAEQRAHDRGRRSGQFLLSLRGLASKHS